ncbi:MULTISPECIES: hypothetical protein [Streptosporangium]|uniref:ABC-type spermidine/putrescine transport system permease subunit II n=1 Tax=Streptosporangium brasiliense TaxID=47480 RepID=A0ABT9RD75_9ACTN|nr:hypothetical protein [Streptosporangium brasiliense]MDP9867211.1 ABC-type spermidine/putrescine transport system permease subunit II [Streptosporangium brasiliense]
MTRNAVRGAALVSLAVITLAFLGPFLWVLLSSVQPGAGLSATPTSAFSFRNFAEVLNWETVYLPIINSVVISGSTAVITVIVAGHADATHRRHGPVRTTRRRGECGGRRSRWG